MTWIESRDQKSIIDYIIKNRNIYSSQIPDIRFVTSLVLRKNCPAKHAEKKIKKREVVDEN